MQMLPWRDTPKPQSWVCLSSSNHSVCVPLSTGAVFRCPTHIGVYLIYIVFNLALHPLLVLFFIQSRFTNTQQPSSHHQDLFKTKQNCWVVTLVKFSFDLECHLELRDKTHEMKMWILKQSRKWMISFLSETHLFRVKCNRMFLGKITQREKSQKIALCSTLAIFSHQVPSIP